jgi:hypothetical protein
MTAAAPNIIIELGEFLTALKNSRLKNVPNNGIVFPPPGRDGVRGPLHLEIEFNA